MNDIAKTDIRRKRIMDAAQCEFAENGFQGTEVKAVAQRASVGKATIYKFFKSKEHLLLTIVEENLMHMRDLALNAVMRNAPPIERLEAAVGAMAKFLEENRDFCNVLIQEAGDFKGEIQKHHFAIVEQHLPLADAFFAALREEGHFTMMGSRETLQLLVDVFVGAVYSWAITESDASLEQQTLSYIRVIIRGLKQ